MVQIPPNSRLGLNLARQLFERDEYMNEYMNEFIGIGRMIARVLRVFERLEDVLALSSAFVGCARRRDSGGLLFFSSQ